MRPTGVGGDFAAWARAHGEELRELLHRAGALLIRGFDIDSPDKFTAIAKALTPELHTEYGDLADEELGEEVYGSTVYPLEDPIHFHNEAASAAEWPLYLFFCCLQPPAEQGATRLVDTRSVLAAMPPETRQAIRDWRLVYLRNHYPNLDVPWQTLFGTSDPRELERRLRAQGIGFEWTGRDSLRTRTASRLLRTHPATGEEALFHHLFLNHPACLDEAARAGLETQFDRLSFPRNALLEDGDGLTDEWVRELFSAYEERAVDIEWRRGDMVVADNMLASHGRAPFRGPRKILVAMGEMVRGAEAAEETPAAPEVVSRALPARRYRSALEEVFARAQERPEAPAIRRGSQRCSYRELTARGFAIAEALERAGAGAGDRVAILGPSSAATIAAMLGAWLRGCSIVPIDRSLPEARRRLIASRAGVKLWLHEGPAEGEGPSLRLDGIEPLSADEIPARLPAQTPGGPLPDEAYVFFTSGTTGEPKGVAGSHNGLAHFLDWQRATFAVGPGDRVAQLTAFSFDVVLRDLFLPLTSGATICLPDEDLDPTNPWEWLRRERVTRLHCVPSLAAHWLGRAGEGDLGLQLKTAFFAGEPLTARLVERWRSAAGPGAEVVNLYGPTETTLAKFWFRVPESPERGVQPIGQPLPGCEALLLDGDRLCGDGETGEIVLRTPYRTHGYLDGDGRPFQPNPLTQDSGDLVYRTGDLGRRRPDGMLDILGRIDDQFKVRGVRVEPSEIVAALSEHPLVRDAFAMRDPADADAVLAYVVAQDSSELRGELLRLAAARLPAAFVPRTIVAVDALPLTPNGKVDRKALPVPSASPAPVERTPPSGPVEIRLASVWRELLAVPEICREDSFFAVGGHSLLAARLLLRVREEWGVTVRIQDVFESHTLADMARLIERSPAAKGDGRLQRLPEGVAHPASFSQRRLWFASQAAPEHGVYNIPGAIRLEGELDVERLRAALQMVVARQASLRTRFVEGDGDLRLVVDASAELALAVADVSALPESQRRDETRRLARQESRRPFDLSRAPLVRALLLRESERTHFLVYTFHHAIADGRSNALFIREVEEHYVALSEGRAPRPPALPNQYADYAAWDRSRVEAVAPSQLARWERRLGGAPELLQLPADAERPEVQTYNGGAVSRELPAELVEQIDALCAQRQTTPFMALLAAFQALLAKLSGQSDFCVGAPVANRHHPCADHLIGCFINTVVLRAEVSPELSFAELLDQAKARTLEAFENQDAPFEQVVARLAPRRDPAYHPVFQALFNVLYHEDTVAETSALRMEREWLVDPETKFDLTLYVVQRPGGLRLRMVYNRDLFSEQRVEQWLERYESFLRLGMAAPQTPLAAFGETFAPAAATTRVNRPPASATDLAAPISPTEAVIAEAWRETLGLAAVERDQSFFELGGHSLQGMAALQRIRRRLDRPVPQWFLFRYPVLRDLAEAVDRLDTPELPPISPSARPGLAPAQQAIWRYQQANPCSCAYYVPRAVRIRGALHVDALQLALAAVLERHAMLRTVYPQGAPDAIAAAQFPLEIVDLTGTPAERRDAVEREQILERVQRPFDLARDLPVRASLLLWSGGEATLAVTTHHIAADCWSMGLPFQAIEESTDPWSPGVFFADLMEIYAAEVAGRAPELPPLAVSYGDVAAWREANRSEGRYREHAAFWRDLLAGAPSMIALPADRPRPDRFDYAGVRREIRLPEGLYGQAAALAGSVAATPFAVFLHAYALCLRDWTGARDFVLGVPVSNRYQPEVRRIIGLVANTVLLRMREVEEGPAGVRALSAQVRRALQFQDYPLEYVLEDMGARPSPADPPQVQLRFVMQHAHEAPLGVAGLDLAPVPIDRGVSKHDLSLVLAVHERRLRGWWEYNTNLFEPATIDALSSRYLETLSGLLAAETAGAASVAVTSSSSR